MTHGNRTRTAAGTVVILTGLAITFQVLQFEFATPARAGGHAADAPDRPAAVPATPPAGRDPQTRLLQPVVVPVTEAHWAEPPAGTWSRPQPLGPVPSVSAYPADVRPMPAAAAAPPRRPATRERPVPFTGTHACRLEDGEALPLPDGVRRQLGASARALYVTPGPGQALWLFTAAGLERWADDLGRSGSARAREARRVCLAQTEACPVDGRGRLHLPERLAQFAGLCQDVVVLGVGDHLELWDAPRWQQHRDER